MPIVRIARRNFLQLPQHELATYAENILTRCSQDPRYAGLKPLLAELRPAVDAFNAALIAARNRSIEAIAARRQGQKNLFIVLDRIANALEYSAPDELYVINAGMKPGGKRQAHRGEIPTPQIHRVVPTGNQGEVVLRLALPDPVQVQTNVIEYSVDEGATWTAGAHDKRPRILLSDLPSGWVLHFRVRSIGTRGRVSAWSTTVTRLVW